MNPTDPAYNKFAYNAIIEFLKSKIDQPTLNKYIILL